MKLSSLMILTLLISTQATAAEIPSCMDLVKDRNEPGATEQCAPPIVQNDAAFKIIKEFGLKQVGLNWYIFGKEEGWKTFNAKSRWQLLITSISAIQSLHTGNADIYMVDLPETETEKASLMLGNYPMSKIKGHAKYNMGKLFNKSNQFPPGHHERMYTLIVY